MQNIQDYVRRTASAAKQASYVVAAAETAQKNDALLRTAELIRHHQTAILAANAQDMEQAAQKGLNDALLDRLRLTEKTIDAMCEGLRQIAALPDPVGEMDEFRTRENGLQIGKMRVPLGVVGIIYESRPNVTADAAALCLKSGNACVLRGGSEAFNSNMALSKLITQALVENGLPAAAVSLIENTDRESVGAMLQSPEFIDVVIPRGGKSLVSRIAAEARVPVIKHLDGICHVFIDRAADAEKAARNIELRGCPRTLSILPHIQTASEEDWDTEYLAPILSVKIVDSLEEAVAHINTHGSHHTDSIVTESYTDARTFLRTVDSASVMVNASTRFADGFEYGLGAEIGISTDKIHVRGPVGLHGLTSQKWIVLGDGQVRS